MAWERLVFDSALFPALPRPAPPRASLEFPSARRPGVLSCALSMQLNEAVGTPWKAGSAPEPRGRGLLAVGRRNTSRYFYLLLPAA